MKNNNLKSFKKELKEKWWHFIKSIINAQGKTMIYYREYGSYPYDIKTILI